MAYLRADGSTGTSSSVITSRSASPALQHHPLTTAAAGSSSSTNTNTSTITISQPSSPSQRHGVRSRKSATSTPNPPSASVFIDSDVTRPSLKRITDSTNTVVEGATLALANDHGISKSAKTSFDELSRPQPREKEVIVHHISKTDTIASIALQYGITVSPVQGHQTPLETDKRKHRFDDLAHQPQALRSSNRLWHSDSIHLRKTLNIPLDQCHLPSASAGIERIEREEDGNIVVWQRERVANASTSSTTSFPSSQLPTMTTTSSTLPATASPLLSSRPGIISPQARRLHSNSTLDFDWNRSASSSSTADLLGLDTTPTELVIGGDHSTNVFDSTLRTSSPRSAVNSNGDVKGKGRAIDAVAAYLPSTNNLYSASSSPAPQPADLAGLAGSADMFPSPSQSPFGASSNSTASMSPPPISKRVLTITRVPESTLAFFPPSSSTSSSTSARSSVSEEEYHHSSAKGSFFGPLANSLARLNISPMTSQPGKTNGKLGAAWSSSSSSTNAVAGKRSKDVHHTGLNPASHHRMTSTGPSGMFRQAEPRRSKWDLAYFGGEEEAESAAARLDSSRPSVQKTNGYRQTMSRSRDKERSRDRNKTPTQASMDRSNQTSNGSLWSSMWAG
ncbi:hypothetical protein OIV83_004907 [Microbotryomycetes sp. JL201]|nr:hypothetical protein OIV83_004907 [Microbotryomycetes sp. JL201]